ncbi:hypothetical protein AHAS_Ahas06G0147900 [Arachis hypogaea]
MTSTQTENKWLKEILKGNNSRCCSMFRMKKDVFKRLCYDLETNYDLCASRRISAAEMLAMFLFVLGGENSNNRKFEEVLQAVYKMAIDIIQPKDRDFKEVPTKLRNDNRYWPHFKDAIGAIDGTHVPVIMSIEDQIRFIGKKGIPTQNVMVACNFDMEFIFALANKYYLVDAGYIEKISYLGPYKGATYHLQNFVVSVIEHTFGVWKKRRNLRDMPSFSYKKQIQIIRCYSTSDRKFKKYDQMDVELEEEDGYGDEGEANEVEKVRDEFLGTMDMAMKVKQMELKKLEMNF